MAKNISGMLDNPEDLYKQFDADYEKMLKLFMNNLKEIQTDSDRSNKKEAFLKMVKKHISIFYYPKNDKKAILTMYMNFGKEHEKVINIMKCDGSLIFREGADNFANQIIVANIKNMSTYLYYLIEFIHDQFQLLSNHDNLNNPNSPLCVFDKKTKNVLKEGSISLKNDQKCNVILKGLGSHGFVGFTIKQLSFKIVFDLGSQINTYMINKANVNKLIIKESPGKKGQDCKELIKWVESNKLNGKRTKYCIVPCQFSFSRIGLAESSLSKRYKKEYEKEGDLCSDLEAYIVKKKAKIINVNMKFGLVVNMHISIDNEECISDFDDFDENKVIVSEVEKQNNIYALHDDFVKQFDHLIKEEYMETVSVKKTNIEIKDQVLNSYERVTVSASSNSDVPLITNPKINLNEEEISDVSDEDDDNEKIE
ncbi:hypothetical protein Yalta_049 [Yalta virus]|nr:hypothetical protein Yalta_049 [Yalta virus]